MAQFSVKIMRLTGSVLGENQHFYNPQRKHVRNGMLSPIAFEQQQQQQKLKLQGVYKSRGYSIKGAAPNRDKTIFLGDAKRAYAKVRGDDPINGQSNPKGSP